MPIMDGLAATRELRQKGYHGLVIGVTGGGLPEDVAAFLQAGADDVLVKPITFQQLERAAVKALRARALMSASTSRLHC